MKKNGFTLIELLAVIVILAIISIIAVPVFLNVISSSKESVQNSSARLIIKSVYTAYNNCATRNSGQIPYDYEVIDEFNEIMNSDTRWNNNDIESSNISCSSNIDDEDSVMKVSCELSDSTILSTKDLSILKSSIWNKRGIKTRNIVYDVNYGSDFGVDDDDLIGLYSNGDLVFGGEHHDSEEVEEHIDEGYLVFQPDGFMLTMEDNHSWLFIITGPDTAKLYINTADIDFDRDAIIASAEGTHLVVDYYIK